MLKISLKVCKGKKFNSNKPNFYFSKYMKTVDLESFYVYKYM